ncbi:hypothetical protein FZC78_03085 [Rossellomorea vietnamensis]|uniref:Uncharacterized protein n=1 Tax=Rossellomorea vietnamensis TaxID=218284 RepID=A0A5D4NYD1_9BACI|nr:hypothetical protein [Rossellomorea vietnamensis]TYS18538.1 hypothetical protein FZC78_03085 [Rossellomorea vietnamensis]
MFALIYLGVFWGILLFVFTYVLSKKYGKYFVPPLVTFFAAVLVTAYGFTYVPGFAGMAYGFIGLGFLITAIIGTISLRFLVGKGEKQRFVKRDLIMLFSLPLVFAASVGIIIITNENYRIIDEGSTKYVEGDGRKYENYYRVTTVSEGTKQVTLTLGKEYLGKEIEVKRVSEKNNTEITVEIKEGEQDNHTPYIMIGIDEIKEPLIVQTTEGVTFESIEDKVGAGN